MKNIGILNLQETEIKLEMNEKSLHMLYTNTKVQGNWFIMAQLQMLYSES